MEFDNPRPIIYESQKMLEIDFQQRKEFELNQNITDDIDHIEIFDLVRNINDPEHPLTLEQLKVINLEDIIVKGHSVLVNFTPTIPHCSMANMIGLMIIVKLKRSLPDYFKIDVRIASGSHINELDLNKQLKDKERVFAAQENQGILRMVNKGIQNTDQIPNYMQILQM